MTASEAAPAPWEIWHARFNFDDRGYKFRPVLVLACSPDGLLAAMITGASNKLSLPLDTPIDDWQEAGLTKPSLVRVDRIALLPPTYLGTAGRIGRLSPRDKHRVSQALAALSR
ncbi:type II toxin-antitoxin system PemK/MazF family toxin [Schaalia dentiphila]|uniref:type II toxin-antitoxin system PemK/MazF family toxin n=1 Tax=Schaalia dentiphila TaxID=3050224 RepID=UPI003D665F9A